MAANDYQLDNSFWGSDYSSDPYNNYAGGFNGNDSTYDLGSGNLFGSSSSSNPWLSSSSTDTPAKEDPSYWDKFTNLFSTTNKDAPWWTALLPTLGTAALGGWALSSRAKDEKQAREENIAFERDKLAQQIALSRDQMAQEMKLAQAKLAAEAAAAKAQALQAAYQTALRGALEGAGLESSALQNFGNIVQTPLLRR